MKTCLKQLTTIYLIYISPQTKYLTVHKNVVSGIDVVENVLLLQLHWRI